MEKERRQLNKPFADKEKRVRLTQIFVYTENVENAKVPVDAIDAVKESPDVTIAGLKAQTDSDEEGNDGDGIAWIPHVPRPHR
jgi:hypothetical protein